jgi:hypothetical protein
VIDRAYYRRGPVSPNPQQVQRVIQRGNEYEILHSVPSKGTVSSVARKSSLQASSLVDGDFDTAWNSRSGETTGVQISFEVPEWVFINVISMTVGFTSSNEKGDLFILNHRIRKISVRHNGDDIGIFDLDPNKRELQDIPVNRGGGKYVIQVIDTVRGDRPDWHEICISELQVWGALPKGHQAVAQQPALAVAAATR